MKFIIDTTNKKILLNPEEEYDVVQLNDFVNAHVFEHYTISFDYNLPVYVKKKIDDVILEKLTEEFEKHNKFNAPKWKPMTPITTPNTGDPLSPPWIVTSTASNPVSFDKEKIEFNHQNVEPIGQAVEQNGGHYGILNEKGKELISGSIKVNGVKIGQVKEVVISEKINKNEPE